MRKTTAALREGDPVFIITERREIKEAKFFGETGCNDGSIWVVRSEDWDGDRETMCFCCQAYLWAENYSGAAERLRKILAIQRQELASQIDTIDSVLASI